MSINNVEEPDSIHDNLLPPDDSPKPSYWNRLTSNNKRKDFQQGLSEIENPDQNKKQKSYQQLRRNGDITYEKLNDAETLKIFREHGENKAFIQNFKEYLKKIKPIEETNQKSYFSGFLYENKSAKNSDCLKTKLVVFDFDFNLYEIDIVSENNKITDLGEERIFDLSYSDHSLKMKIMMDIMKYQFNHILYKPQDFMDKSEKWRDFRGDYGILNEAEFTKEQKSSIIEIVENGDSAKFALISENADILIIEVTKDLHGKYSSNTTKTLKLGYSQNDKFYVTLSVKGRYLLVFKENNLKTSDEKIDVYEIEKLSHKPQGKKSFKVDPRISTFILEDDLNVLIVATRDGKIHFHDTRLPERVYTASIHSYNISKLFCVEDSVISLSGDKKIKITKIPAELNKLQVVNARSQHFCSSCDSEGKINFLYYLENGKIQATKFSKMFSEQYEVSLKNREERKEETEDNEKILIESFDHNLIKVESGFLCVYKEMKEINNRKISFILKEDIKIQKKKNTEYHSMVLIMERFLFCAGNDPVIIVYDIQENHRETFTYECRGNESPSALGSLTIVKSSDDWNVYGTCPTYREHYLIVGLRDGTALYLKVEDQLKDNLIELNTINKQGVSTAENKIRDIEKVFGNHDSAVISIVSFNKLIWTSGSDRKIKIWNEPDKLTDLSKAKDAISHNIVHVISSKNGVVPYLAPINNEYVLTCTIFGFANIYSSKTYSTLFRLNLFGPVNCLKVHRNNDITFIIYSNPNGILIQELNILENLTEILEKNPNEIIELTFIGPNENQLYQAVEYFNDIISYRVPEFNEDFDKWIILPHLITPLHLYAQFNIVPYIARSLTAGGSFNESALYHSPLTLAVALDHEECVMTMMKILKFQLVDNPYLINFLGDTNLIEMNFNGRNSLTLFYRMLLKKTKIGYPPEQIDSRIKLPLIKDDDAFITDFNRVFKELAPAENNKKENRRGASSEAETSAEGSQSAKSSEEKSNIKGNLSENKQIQKNIEEKMSVIFMKSLIKISQKIGEKRSVELLKSFIKCSNVSIFSTPFVQSYIDYKYQQVKKWLYLDFILYLIYMIMLLIYIVADNGVSSALIALPLLVGVLLTIFEVFRVLSYRRDYFDFWNICNGIRSILFYIFLGLTWHQATNNKSIHDIKAIQLPLFLLTFLTFVKGLTTFRLFDSTRYFLYLMQRVIIDSIAFLTVIMYVLLVTALVLYQASLYTGDIEVFLGDAFLIVTGALDPVAIKFTIAEIVIFVFAVLIMTWIMMNLLVAIYNNSFQTVFNTHEAYSYRTKATLAYEIEQMIYLCIRTVDRLFRRKQGVRGRVKSTETYLLVCKESLEDQDEDPQMVQVHKTKKYIKDMIDQMKEISKLTDNIEKKSLDTLRNNLKEKPKGSQEKNHKGIQEKEKTEFSIFKALIQGLDNKSTIKDHNSIKEIGSLLKDLDIIDSKN